MKKLFLLALLALAGCSQQIYVAYPILQKMQEVCSPYGGTKQVTVRQMNVTLITFGATCNNGIYTSQTMDNK